MNLVNLPDVNRIQNVEPVIEVYNYEQIKELKSGNMRNNSDGVSRALGFDNNPQRFLYNKENRVYN